MMWSRHSRRQDSQTNNRRSALLRAGLFGDLLKPVDLLAKDQDLRFTPRAGLEQSNERTTKQSEQLDHRATASPDSHRFASYMEFPTGTTDGSRLDAKVRESRDGRS